MYKDYGLLKNGFPAESVTNGSVLVVKTHEWGPTARSKFAKAILLIRTPGAAIQAEFNRQSGGHIGFASPDRYKRTKGKCTSLPLSLVPFEHIVCYRLATVRDGQAPRLETHEPGLAVQLHRSHARDLLRAAGGEHGAHPTLHTGVHGGTHPAPFQMRRRTQGGHLQEEETGAELRSVHGQDEEDAGGGADDRLRCDLQLRISGPDEMMAPVGITRMTITRIVKKGKLRAMFFLSICFCV